MVGGVAGGSWCVCVSLSELAHPLTPPRGAPEGSRLLFGIGSRPRGPEAERTRTTAAAALRRWRLAAVLRRVRVRRGASGDPRWRLVRGVETLDHYNNFFELELGAAAPAELTVTAEIAQILVRISTRAVALTFKLQWRWSVVQHHTARSRRNCASGQWSGPRPTQQAPRGAGQRWAHPAGEAAPRAYVYES